MKDDLPIRVIAHLVRQFKELRLAKGMSHEKLAEKSGVTRAAISHIEGGKRKPSLHMSLKIAEALEADLSDLIRQAEDREERD